MSRSVVLACYMLSGSFMIVR